MALVKEVVAKFGPMRKPQGFVVYHRQDGESVTVQSDRTIGQFNPDTRKGVVNFKRQHPVFIDLMKLRGAVEFEFPADFVAECLANQPKSGDLIGSSPICGSVYVA